MYAKETTSQKKCPCGKTLSLKTRRIIKKTDDVRIASQMVRKLQEEKYGDAYFIPADKI